MVQWIKGFVSAFTPKLVTVSSAIYEASCSIATDGYSDHHDSVHNLIKSYVGSDIPSNCTDNIRSEHIASKIVRLQTHFNMHTLSKFHTANFS